MGLNEILKRSSKGQLMTLVMLIIFVLLLAELFAFALLNTSSNTIAQSLTLSSSSANYGNLFKLSANGFASQSLSRAITTLANYELTPSYRKGNFITNTSLYLSYLVTNGMLPNDTSGYPQNAMGNLTLKLYNLSVANVISFASQSVTVNETQPLVFQSDPYHIRISYTERIVVNSSGNYYKYMIPVNVSLPLNGTPDLFYSQQGIPSQIRFGSTANITSVIGGDIATSGNTLSYAYGTVYWLSSSASSGASCSSVPSGLSSSAVSGNIIIATYNAIGLESCENNYAGLVTYIAPTTLPTVPYLIYSSSSDFLQMIPSGTRMLLWGPGLEALNIEGLRNAVSNGYYFASPFTPTYLDRGQADFNSASPSGIFTFSNYNGQAASLSESSSQYVSVSDNAFLDPTNTITIAAWVNSNLVDGNRHNIVVKDGQYFLKLENNNYFQAGIWGQTETHTTTSPSTNTWYFVVFTYDGSTAKIYLNGAMQASNAFSASIPTSTKNLDIGTDEYVGNYWSGEIANVQVYNESLTAWQIQRLYSEGISGVPASSSGLVGWWPLNGNAQDYSGHANVGTLVNGAAFGPLQNYERDSILNTPVSTSLSAMPGILSCTSSSNCGSSTTAQLYLGYMPLEQTNAHLQVGNFNGASSQIVESSPAMTLGPSYGISFWIYPTSFATQPESIEQSGGVIQDGPPYSSTGQINVGMYIGGTYYSYKTPTSIEVPLDSWSNIAFTLNTLASGGNVLTECANGVCNSITVASGAIATVSNSIYIGSSAGTGGWVDGQLSNFQIYSNPLTTNQIAQLYNEGIAGIPIQNKLLAWWPLNGNANDYSGGDYNGVGTNVNYPYLAGTYNAPGLSTIAVSANEWQALGIPVAP